LTLWLINQDVGLELARARVSVPPPSPEQLAKFLESRADPVGNIEQLALTADMPRNMSVAGDVAEIRIHGTLTKAPDWYAAYYGGGNCTYRSIVLALAHAQANSQVRSVILNIDSPGGHVDGLHDAIGALQAFTKPLSVRASCACSAAYALAANGGKITAESKAANFGSIGTAVSFYIDENVVTLTNSDSPDKRPDVTKAEGKRVVVEYLDAVNDLFVEAIATGRGGGLTAQTVSKKFGRGAVLLAEESLGRGMIDKIAKPTLGYSRSESDDSDEEAEAPMNLAILKANHPEVYAAAVNEGRVAPAPVPPAPAPAAATPSASAAPGGAPAKETNMDLDTLRAQHPAVYKAAVAEGVKQEKERVEAHLELGESCEAMDLAVKMIKSGDDLRPTITAKYVAQSQKKKAIATRQEESNAAGEGADGATTPAPVSKDIGDLVADAMDLPPAPATAGKKVA
jgi:ClpP class serine protease